MVLSSWHIPTRRTPPPTTATSSLSSSSPSDVSKETRVSLKKSKTDNQLQIVLVSDRVPGSTPRKSSLPTYDPRVWASQLLAPLWVVSLSARSGLLRLPTLDPRPTSSSCPSTSSRLSWSTSATPRPSERLLRSLIRTSESSTSTRRRRLLLSRC